MGSDLHGGGPPPRALIRRNLFAWASFAGLAAAIVFVGFPQIDIVVSRLFVLDNGQFVFNYPSTGRDLRYVFKIFFFIACAIALVALVCSLYFTRDVLKLSSLSWLFLILCLVLGPGLMANTILKNNWGRARPMHIEEFGGSKEFTPVLEYSDQCETNCSFISGEAASMFMLFFALAFLFPRRTRILFACGIISGTTVGLVRVGQGGHFISDVIFAGIFMALLVMILSYVVLDIGQRRISIWQARRKRQYRPVEPQYPTFFR